MAGRKVWTVWRVAFHLNFCKSAVILLAVWSLALLWSGITPRVSSCRKHSLLHMQQYCHWFAHSRLQLVSFWMPLILRTNYDRHRSFHFGHAVLSTHISLKHLHTVHCKIIGILYTRGGQPAAHVPLVAHECSLSGTHSWSLKNNITVNIFLLYNFCNRKIHTTHSLISFSGFNLNIFPSFHAVLLEEYIDTIFFILSGTLEWGWLTLMMPRAWDIGYTQPFINCRGKSATDFVYFWSRKTLP